VTSDSTDTSVVVIGGGQAGLSVSYYLKRLGLEPGNEFVVLDRSPGSGGAWQFRWDALRIGSAHRINDLPGMDAIGRSFETADRHRPAKEVVAEYYAEYEEHFGFQVVRPAAVSRVENAGDRMIVTFSDGEGVQTVSTDVVINATGTWGSPFIPWYPGRDSFAGRHVHTAEYVDAAEFAGKKVVVVGGGTSAIGFLLELEPVAAETTWVSRRPVEFLEDGELNLEARASAVAMQDEAARAGRALPSIVSGTGVPRTRRIQAGIDRGVLTVRPMFSSIEPGGVRWSNGDFQEADVIIWSTGFRPELRHLAALKLREKEGGIIVANGTSWKEPRIFFAGYGPQASTIGANRAGRTVARQAIATLSRLKRQEREAEEELRAAQGKQTFSFDFAPPPVSTGPAPSHAAVPEPGDPAEGTGPQLSDDVLARLVADETETALHQAPESQEDIDLSWMMPSDEPMDPLDYLHQPAAVDALDPESFDPEAPTEQIVVVEPAPAVEPEPTVEPEPIAAAAPTPPTGQPDVPAIELTRFAGLAKAEAAAFVEREPVIAWYSDPTPTVAFAFDGAGAKELGADDASADEAAADESSPVESSPIEPDLAAAPEADLPYLPEPHVEPTRDADSESSVAVESRAWSAPDLYDLPVVYVDPDPEPAPSPESGPVLTMEELFAPVLDPDDRHEARAAADHRPWAEVDADAHRARPFTLDVEPEFDDADDDREAPTPARPPRRELPDFDELLRPRDDD
jgi:cation diffusion facilitator CzcD-associated flavoprotein CzcO